MIDIHAHILPCIDDGSTSLDQSFELLNECVNQGISDLILTPHRRNDYKVSALDTQAQFDKFDTQAKEKDIPINLYLGQEVFIDKDYKDLLKSGEFLTLADSKYVLIEFSVSEQDDVSEAVYEIARMGYIPIIAHCERYSYLTISDIFEIKDLGGLIQVNADSIVGKYKRLFKKRIKELFKNDLVDFVASDVHFGRNNCMQKAREYVNKKYGEEIMNKVFIENAKLIIKG